MTCLSKIVEKLGKHGVPSFIRGILHCESPPGPGHASRTRTEVLLRHLHLRPLAVSQVLLIRDMGKKRTTCLQHALNMGAREAYMQDGTKRALFGNSCHGGLSRVAQY